ncbi:MAG: PAS domain S-box protein [Methanoregula sp.]|jgi:PAS domain S-box-containing protein
MITRYEPITGDDKGEQEQTAFSRSGRAGAPFVRGLSMIKITRVQLVWILLTLTITAAIILTTIFSLKNGITEVFPYFYLIPIIMLAITQPQFAIYFTILLGWAYLALIYVYGPFDFRLYASSTAWFYIFVTVGIIISSFVNKLNQEQRFRDIFSHSQTGIFTFDTTSGKILEINEKANLMFGYGPEEISTLRIPQIFSEHETGERFLARLNAENQIGDVEMVLRRKDGTTLWGLMTVSLDKNLIAICSVIDVTDRKRAVEALVQSEEKYRTLVESSDDAIMIVDRENRILYTNSGMPSLLGTTVEAMTGRSVRDFGRPGIADSLDALLHKVFETQKPIRTDFFMDVNGRSIWGDLHLVPIRDKMGEFMTVLLMIHDITKRKDLEEALLLSVKEKEVMIKEIHHRVRNNLQIIGSMISLQERPIRDPAILHEITKIKTRIGTMALVHEIAYNHNTPDSINIRNLISKATSRIIDTMKRKNGTIEINFSVQEIDMPLTIAVPFSIIIVELLMNSVQHAFPEGGIGSITIDFVCNEKNYILNYSDSGVGFPVDQSPDTAETGGLFLLKGLVRQLRGTLEYHARPETGFTLTFPRDQVPAVTKT